MFVPEKVLEINLGMTHERSTHDMCLQRSRGTAEASHSELQYI